MIPESVVEWILGRGYTEFPRHEGVDPDGSLNFAKRLGRPDLPCATNDHRVSWVLQLIPVDGRWLPDITMAAETPEGRWFRGGVYSFPIEEIEAVLPAAEADLVAAWEAVYRRQQRQ